MSEENWWEDKKEEEATPPVDENPFGNKKPKQVKQKKEEVFKTPMNISKTLLSFLKFLAFLNLAVDILLLAFLVSANSLVIQIAAAAFFVPNTIMLIHYTRLIGEKNAIPDWT